MPELTRITPAVIMQRARSGAPRSRGRHSTGRSLEYSASEADSTVKERRRGPANVRHALALPFP